MTLVKMNQVNIIVISMGPTILLFRGVGGRGTGITC
jgi:hypothetical protein